MIDADNIAAKLWLGSRPPSGLRVYGFDVVVLCAQELQNIPVDVVAIKAPLNDDAEYGLTTPEVRLALRTAQKVNSFRRKGAKVLVTCAAGVNRSALVTALALMLDGTPATAAVTRIRKLRKPPIGLQPLSNPRFVELLCDPRAVNRAFRV